MNRCFRQSRVSWVELLVVLAVSIAAVLATQIGSMPQRTGSEHPDLAAAETMQRASEILLAHRSQHGPAIDPGIDINETGLIGTFYSSITTTVGHLEAKRTTTNPNVAGLAVHLLLEAGVHRGDFVAVGASGSFPALILAILSAADALGVRAGLIPSLGASQFGANDLGFTWLDIEQVLVESGLFPMSSVGASLGGDLDIARDLSPEARAALRETVERAGLPLIDEPVLIDNVRLRMGILSEVAGESGIAAFVNVGGAWANLGVDPSVLSIAPGLVDVTSMPHEEDRGLIHAMAAEGIPVIHLLNIRELAQKHGLPWDPSPLPVPSQFAGGMEEDPLWIDFVYVLCMGFWLVSVYVRRRSCQGKHSSRSAV